MTAKPMILDAFCCGGMAGWGYHLAGFRVIGIDIEPQPKYPFEFIQGDAIQHIKENAFKYDAIHASPRHVNTHPKQRSNTGYKERFMRTLFRQLAKPCATLESPM